MSLPCLNKVILSYPILLDVGSRPWGGGGGTWPMFGYRGAAKGSKS